MIKFLNKHKGKILGFIVPIISYNFILYPIPSLGVVTKVFLRFVLVIIIILGVGIGANYDN